LKHLIGTNYPLDESADPVIRTNIVNGDFTVVAAIPYINGI
jgi:hypothetical protein